MLYHEGWGVESIKHSLTYSGGLSRGYMRTFSPADLLGFEGFSPYTLPNVIEISEGIPYIDLTDWDHQKLYDLKGQIVAAGVKAVTGIDMPVFEKRRFQHGAASHIILASIFPKKTSHIERNSCQNMSKGEDNLMNSNWIVSKRPERNHIDPNRPYAWLVEKERSASGRLQDTGIIFLSNKECSFRCLMCDLWKNTTEESVPEGAIPKQIKWALEQMPGIKHVKLYNSGSFFDEKAIPVKDYKDIASLVSGFETVVVEAHPRLINKRCLEFRDSVKSGA